jgi:large subunit ribosomal protein L29
MKVREMREIPAEELKGKMEDFKDELANLNIQKATHQLANPSRIKLVRRNIAKIRCILREYELGISQPKTETKA